MTSRTRQEPPGRKVTAGLSPWGILVVSLAAMSGIARLLSGHLGRFWSLAAFLPIWATFYVVIHIVRTRMEGRHDRE